MLSNKEKAKGYYKVLSEKSENIICTLHQKWQGDLNYTFEESQWYKIFKICFKVVKDNNIIWFQYRLIHRILGTRSLLHKMSIETDNKCHFCNVSSETLINLFYSCPKVKLLWQQVENWVKLKTSVPLKLTLPEILLGYMKPERFIPVNTIILCTKKYIFSSSSSGQILSISELKIKIKTVYEEQYFLAKLDLTKDYFENCWTIYNSIFHTENLHP